MAASLQPEYTLQFHPHCVSNLGVSVLVEFAKLIQTMWTSSSSEAVSPSEFKTQIQRYAPRFVGYK